MLSSLWKILSKMMRRRERGGEVLEAPDIPLDLQIEILNRLPIKSLSRFKCVSKLWFSVICSKGYLFPSPPRLFICLGQELLSLSLASSSTVFDLDLKKQGIGGHDMVVLRGLILYTVCRQACIYNPTTGQRVTLPAIILAGEIKILKLDYIFGYDPIADQYKVVCTAVIRLVKYERVYPQHWVFVLEAGSSWKRIEFDHPHVYVSTRRGLCINGIIYYFAYVSVVNLIGFNVRSEVFSMIQLPHAVSENWNLVGLIEYGGKPTLFDYINLKDSLVNLWVLEDIAKWSRKSLVLQPCQMHFFPDTISFDVIGTTQKGEVVLKPRVMSFPYYILYHDLHKNNVRRVYIRGIWEYPLNLALMDTGESIMHLKI